MVNVVKEHAKLPWCIVPVVLLLVVASLTVYSHVLSNLLSFILEYQSMIKIYSTVIHIIICYTDGQ